MKNINTQLVCLAIVLTTGGCSVFKNAEPTYEIDPVCHMKVDKREAFTYKHQGTKYFFDNINCRKAFEMNPEEILRKSNCETKN